MGFNKVRVYPPPNYLGEVRRIDGIHRLHFDADFILSPPDRQWIFDLEWVADDALCDLCPMLRPYLFPGSEEISK